MNQQNNEIGSPSNDIDSASSAINSQNEKNRKIIGKSKENHRNNYGSNYCGF